jgi:transposase
MNKSETLVIGIEDIEALLERIKGKISDGDYEIIKALCETIELLSQSVDDKASSIKRLLRMLFGSGTEKLKNVICTSDEEKKGSGEEEACDDKPGEAGEDSDKENKKKKKKRKGHGRNGVADYPGAEKIRLPYLKLRSGDPCPLCIRGKVYVMREPKVTIRFRARAPVHATIYERERLRCNLCGKIFTAEMPDAAGSKKYDETVAAVIALLRYGSGFPFYRLEQLQASFGIPLSASTQWDIGEGGADKIHPVFTELCRLGAQGHLIYNDDTTMKILELMGKRKNTEKNEEKDPKRKGIFTTGILSIVGDLKIALYFTGRNHAGENMATLLEKRGSGLDTPIQMCDALSRNVPKQFETIVCNCLSHARRKFVDILWNFPEECRHVLEILAKVYRNDEIAKEKKMPPDERLQFHQTESGPLMETLKNWIHEQFDEKKIEPNCGVGNAFTYMLKHWKPLTRFLEVPGAPLDNNLCEQILKRSILHRKNSLFYKTEHGAYIGDLYMSLIHTCRLAGVNPFDYLTTLQKYSSEVFKNPSKWLPWNYKEAIPPLPRSP